MATIGKTDSQVEFKVPQSRRSKKYQQGRGPAQGGESNRRRKQRIGREQNKGRKH